MIIISERTVLRPFSLNDMDALYRMSMEEDIKKYTDILVTDKRSLKKKINVYKSSDFVNEFCFVIVEKASKEVIGCFCGIAIVPKIIEVICCLTKDKRGQGFMQEAIIAFCKQVDRCFVLKFTVSNKNKSAERFVKKLGAKYDFSIGENKVFLLYNNLKELE
ncbi:MAG: GNAT family N-acetyltransferase [Clostridia bacterium]|nr:GNAT family N-acetyltransferase [Clostridia bacterium]